MVLLWNSAILPSVLLCLISSVTTEDTSAPIHITEETATRLEGSCVLIDCTYKDQKEMQLLWLKDPMWNDNQERNWTTVYSNTKQWPQSSEYTDRVEFFNEHKSYNDGAKNIIIKNCSLKINNLQKKDSGNYVFTYKMDNDKDLSKMFNLIVTDNPCQVHVMPPNLNKSFKEGDSASLLCATSAACEFHPNWQSFGSSEVLGLEKKEDGEKRNELNLTVSWTDDGRTLTCRTSGSLGDACLERSVTLSVQYAPKATKVINSSSHKDVKEGETLTISCSSKAHPKATFTWFKYQSSFSQPGETLTLYSVTPEKGGVYYCQAKNEYGTENSNNISITVTFPPKDVSITPTSIELKEGDQLTLTCSVQNSYPEVNQNSYTWYKDEQEMKQTINLLTVQNVTQLDNGKYNCKARNSIGETMSANNVSVFVKYAPKHTHIQGTLEIKVGLTFTLKCITEADPLPSTYFWYFKPEHEQQFLSLSETRQVYQIEKVAVSNAGLYKCMAYNIIGPGVTSAEVNAIMLYAPKETKVINSSSHKDVKEGETLTISCSSKAHPKATFTWFKYQSSFSQPGETLTLYSVTPEKGGVYYCQAKNEYGTENSNNISITVTFPPKDVSITPTSIELKEGDQLTLTCSVQNSYPEVNQNSYTWYKDGQEMKQTINLLTVQNVTQLDNGKYNCKARNSIGETMSTNNVSVFVKYAPKHTHIQGTLEIKVGLTFTLKCITEADPLPSTYFWYFKPEHEQQFLSLSETRQVYQIEKVAVSNAGLYKCMAYNIIGPGVTSAEVNAIVLYQPRITIIHNLTSLGVLEKAVPVHLNCSVQCDPPATFFAWYMLEENTTALSYNQSYTVQPQNPGTYYCYASNEVGQSRSEPVKIYLNHFFIKRLIQVIISLLVILFLIGFVFLLKRIILRNKSSGNNEGRQLSCFFFSVAPLSSLSNLCSLGSNQDTRENLVMEGSTELSGFRVHRPAIAAHSNLPANRNEQAGRPNSNVHSVYDVIKLPPSMQKHHYTEEDLSMTTVDYSMLQFMDSNKPKKSVPSHGGCIPAYAEVSKIKQMAKKQDVHVDYENVSGACGPSPPFPNINWDSDSSESEEEIKYTTVSFTVTSHPKPQKNISGSDENISGACGPSPPFPNINWDSDSSESEEDINYTKVSFTVNSHPKPQKDIFGSDEEEKNEYSEVKI